MTEGSGNFLPGIGDYNEFRHRLEDEKEAEEIKKRHEQKRNLGYYEVDADEEVQEDQDDD
ncbi:hypothetical protein K0A96_02080 [Patescibacteria group bacterium]|nr:hypothetical protein [Patescibacteria group bacterium]